MSGRRVRQVVRETLAELGHVDDAKALSHEVIERMSEAERVDALLALLPRLIRAEDNARLRAAGQVERERVWVGEDKRLGETTVTELGYLADERERLGSALVDRAEVLRQLADARQPVPDSRSLRQRRRTAEARLRALSLLREVVAGERATSGSLEVSALEADLVTWRARQERADAELAWLRERAKLILEGLPAFAGRPLGVRVAEVLSGER